MSKVKFSDWQKIVKANVADPAIVEFDVGEEVISVEVQRHVALSDRVSIVNTVVGACQPLPTDYVYDANTSESTVDAHRKVALEYLEPVFRATVLRYYTNLDFSAKSADLEAIWELAGNDDIYNKLTMPIEDKLYELYDSCYTALEKRMGACEELAGRVLNVLDQIEAVIPQNLTNEFTNLLKQSYDLDLTTNNA